MANRTAGPVGTFVIGLIFIAIGVGGVHFYAGPKIKEAKESVKWPSVTGKVLTSDVNTSRNSDGKTMYSAEVAFNYTVEGKTYTSSSIDMGPKSSSSSSSDAYNTAGQYPVGKSVSVYYNPELPSHGVLETGVPTSLTIIYWGGWVFAGIGVLLTFKLLFKILLIVGVLATTKSG